MTAVDNITTAPPELAIEEGGAVMERLFETLLGSLELATVHLGAQLGLYTALAQPRTAAELAAEAGIDERYAREWLEQQAITGLVEVAEPGDTTSGATSPARASGAWPRPVPRLRRLDGPAAGRSRHRARRLPEAYRDGTASPSASTATTSGSVRGCSTGEPSSSS